MPPPVPQLSDARVMEFLRELRPGLYMLDITPAFEPFLAPSGGSYFGVGNNTFMIWRSDEPKGLRRVDRRVAELEVLAQKLIAYCDAAVHRDMQYNDERAQLIEIANGGSGRN